MDLIVECPVCTLYLRSGMSLEEHLDTHPKEKVIKALASISLKKATLGAQFEQTQPLLPLQSQTPAIALAAYSTGTSTPSNSITIVNRESSSVQVPPDITACDAAPSTSGDIPEEHVVSRIGGKLPGNSTLSILPRYTNERYSGPPPPYKSRRVHQQTQEAQPQQQTPSPLQMKLQQTQPQSQAQVQQQAELQQQQQIQSQQKQQTQPHPQPQPQPHPQPHAQQHIQSQSMAQLHQQQQQQQQQHLLHQSIYSQHKQPTSTPAESLASVPTLNTSANLKTNNTRETAAGGSVDLQSVSPVLFGGLIAPHVDAPQAIPGRAVTIQRIESTTEATPVRKRPEDVRVLSDVKVTAPLSECVKDVILNLKAKKLPLNIGDNTSLIQPSTHRVASLNSSDSELLLNDSVNELVINPESDMPDIDFGQVHAIEIRNEGDEDEDGGPNDTNGQCMRDVVDDQDADVSEDSAGFYKRRKRRGESRCGGTKRMRGMGGAKDCYIGNLSLNVKSVSTASSSSVSTGPTDKLTLTSTASSSNSSCASAMVTSVIRKTPHPSPAPLVPSQLTNTATQAKATPVRQVQCKATTPRARETMAVSASAAAPTHGSRCPEVALVANAVVEVAASTTAPSFALAGVPAGMAPSAGVTTAVGATANEVIEIMTSSPSSVELHTTSASSLCQFEAIFEQTRNITYSVNSRGNVVINRLSSNPPNPAEGGMPSTHATTLTNAAPVAAATRAGDPPRTASQPSLPVPRPRRMRQTAHMSTSRPAPGAQYNTSVADRALWLATIRSGRRVPITRREVFESRLADMAPNMEPHECYKLHYMNDAGHMKCNLVRYPVPEVNQFIKQEGIAVQQCSVMKRGADCSDSASSALDDALMAHYNEGSEVSLSLPTMNSDEIIEELDLDEDVGEEEEEDEEDDEEEDEEDDADDEEYGDEEDEEDNEDDERPDDRQPDADGRDGQQEPQNRQQQQQHQPDDEHRREQRDREQQNRRGQSRRQRPKKDDGFQSQEDEEIVTRKPDSSSSSSSSHSLPVDSFGGPRVKQEQDQCQEKLLTHASLECFEMVETTAVAEVEVVSEEIARKPSAEASTPDVAAYERYQAPGAAQDEAMLRCCGLSMRSQPEKSVCVLTTPEEVRDFFEAGPSSQKSFPCVLAGAIISSIQQQSDNNRPPVPPGQLDADNKDFLEAGPSTRAVAPSSADAVAASVASNALTSTHRSAFQEYDWFRHSLSLHPSSASGATTPTEQDGIPLSWARKFSPQYSSAALAASGELLDGGDESVPDGAAEEGADVKLVPFRRRDAHAGEHDSSSSYVEVPLRDCKPSTDTIRATSDTSVSLDGEVDGGRCGKDSTASGGAIPKIEDPANRHSSVSSIASNSLERAPSTESLNIRTDEKMPAKGEISEQESNGDMELTSWNQLCAVSENVPVYPSSYDPSTAQECWNLSNRNLGNHSAFITGDSGGGPPFFSKAGGNYNSLTHSYLSPRMPFPFSSGSQTLLSNYRSGSDAGAGDCKDEEDDGPDDEDDDNANDEEERERSGSMKRLIPKIRFDEMDADNTGSRLQQQQQQQTLITISGPSFVDGMLEEKYSPEAAGTSHFVGVALASRGVSIKVRPPSFTMIPIRPTNEPKPSGSGTARTYRCTKCPKAFNSLKLRREHQQQEHPGNGQLQAVVKQQQKQQPKPKLEPQLPATCEFAEECKDGILAEKPAPARLLPVVMSYDWLRMELQRKYALVPPPLNPLVDVAVATVVHRRSFVCPVCQVEFERFNQFNTHLSVHPSECLACGRYFKQWRNFTLHLKRHLGIKEHGCRVCGKHFVIKQKLIEHMRVHSGHAPIRCKLCNRHFKRFSNLAQHRNRYHLNKAVVKHEYVCSQCGDVFPTRAKMEWHKETHDQKPKPCPYCREKFIHQNSLTRHVRLSHTDKYALLENKTAPCTVCQQPYTKASMRRHMETHAEGRLVFSCSICNKHFTTNWNLKQHKWTHANPTLKPFQCTLCPAGFVRESDFLTHVNSHRSIRPYTCNHCGRQFIRKYNWVRHSREHETDKVHNCEVCGRQFHRKYYLTEHTRIHTGERPYACNICGKTSSTKTNHNKHVRIHHARDPLTAEG